MTIDISVLIYLLVAFQVKHWFCDYPLQNQYMLRKSASLADEWVLPLMLHSSVHAVGTFVVIFLVLVTDTAVRLTLQECLLMAGVDGVVHFCIDRVKASPKIGGRFKPNQPQFWWALGADQMSHHLTHYVFIYVVLST